MLDVVDEAGFFNASSWIQECPRFRNSHDLHPGAAGVRLCDGTFDVAIAQEDHEGFREGIDPQHLSSPSRVTVSTDGEARAASQRQVMRAKRATSAMVLKREAWAATPPESRATVSFTFPRSGKSVGATSAGEALPRAKAFR